MKCLSKCPSFTNQAYSAPCVTLTYLQICHILSPNLFKTGSLFKTHWNIDQAYLEPYHGALFSHIQAYSEPRTMLAYAEGCHTWNPGIPKTLPQLHPHVYSESCYICENLQIFRTLAYLKSDTYLQPSYRVTGFDLTFQKWFVSLPNEVNNKTDLNVAHHVSEKKILHSRLSKLALSSIFYLFIFLRISDLHLAPEVFNKKQTV